MTGPEYQSLVGEVTMMIAESGMFVNPLTETTNRETIKAGTTTVVNIEKPEKKVRGKRKTKPESEKVGKTICDPKNNFFNVHGDNSFEIIKSAKGPFKGNYAKIRDFLSGEWSNRKLFSKKDLVNALTEKYPEDSSSNSEGKFKIQGAAWVYGCKRENTDEWHVLPLLMKVERGLFQNPFFVEGE